MASDPHLGDIFMFAGNFPIANPLTLQCNGQILPIPQFTALYSVIGTQYGGNGTTTFALPNLMGSCPVMTDMPAIFNPQNNYPMGAAGGERSVTLTLNELPTHNHNGGIAAAIGTGGPAVTASTIDSLPGTTTGTALYATSAVNESYMAPMITNVSGPTQAIGGNGPHNNMQPYLTVNFLIALQGAFPPRT